MECQLKVLPDSGRALSGGARLVLRVRKALSYLLRCARKAVADPRVPLARLGGLLSARRSRRDRRQPEGGATRHVLGLQPGERVRVKAAEEIRRSLNERGEFDRLAYMESVMDPYCEGMYTVKKRIGKFFDERTRRFIILSDVVILEGVFCESSPGQYEDWAGCDRCCFLFWKEAWLERESE